MFAFRVHAHVHGNVNTAYRIRDNKWTEIAKGDPQLPQAFYPTSSLYEIKDGDILVGMCTYHNDENRTVYPGSTHTDEMCNIYIMYYTKKDPKYHGYMCWQFISQFGAYNILYIQFMIIIK